MLKINKPAPCDLGQQITSFALILWQHRLWSMVILLTEWQSRSIKSLFISSVISSKLGKSHFLCKRTNFETSKRLIRYPNAYKMYFTDAHKIAMSPSLPLCNILRGIIKVQNVHDSVWCMRTPTITGVEKEKGEISKGYNEQRLEPHNWHLCLGACSWLSSVRLKTSCVSLLDHNYNTDRARTKAFLTRSCNKRYSAWLCEERGSCPCPDLSQDLVMEQLPLDILKMEPQVFHTPIW